MVQCVLQGKCWAAPSVRRPGPAPQGSGKEAVMPSIYSLNQKTCVGGLCYVGCQLSSLCPILQLLCPSSAVQSCTSLVSTAGSRGPRQSPVFSNEKGSLVWRWKLSTDSLKYVGLSLSLKLKVILFSYLPASFWCHIYYVTGDFW